MFFPLLAYVIPEVLPLWLMGSALASSRFLWSHLVLALSNVEETSGIFSHKPTLCLPYTLKSCHSNSIHRVIWMSAFLHYSIRSQLPLLLKRQQICVFFTYRMTFHSPNCLLFSSPTKVTINNPQQLFLKVACICSCVKPSFFVNDLSFFQPDLSAGITFPTHCAKVFLHSKF